MVSYWGTLFMVVLLHTSGTQSSGGSRKTAAGSNVSSSSNVRGNVPVGADIKASVNFDCPEEFGYYPHPNDCTQYYVCVFGGALLESCTGGLMYSHELQTCDWPRNVGCDGLGEVEVAAPISSSVSSRERIPETRSRYSQAQPPPPPAQPAAVVTSRGQPRERQLNHNQQEIIKQKQQQQLYAEAEETLPLAEEIESDRQQRVYRGQPSTVGQVQRDRDGLRHTNAIPSYSGRSEKIGVISFGTGQQGLQQYSIVTNVPDILTNDLTLKRSKRQIQQRLQLPQKSINIPETSNLQRGVQVTTNFSVRNKQNNLATSSPDPTTLKSTILVSSSDITPSGSETQTSRAPPQRRTDRHHKNQATTTEHSVYTHKFPRHHFQFSWPIEEAEAELSSKSPFTQNDNSFEKQMELENLAFEKGSASKTNSTQVPLYADYSSVDTQNEPRAQTSNEEREREEEGTTPKPQKSPFYDFFFSEEPGTTTPQPKQQQKTEPTIEFDNNSEEHEQEETNTKKSISSDSDEKEKFVDIPNPFADPNFDFNAYLQELKARPSPLQAEQQQQQQQGSTSESKQQTGILYPNQAIPQNVYRPYKPYAIIPVPVTTTLAPGTYRDYPVTYLPDKSIKHFEKNPALSTAVRDALKTIHNPYGSVDQPYRSHTALKPIQAKPGSSSGYSNPSLKSENRGPQTFKNSHILAFNLNTQKAGYIPLQNNNHKPATPKVQVKHVPVVATDDYYYYYYDDEPQQTQQQTKSPSTSNKVEVPNKKLEDDEYYYYEYYEDPEEKNKTTKNDAAIIRYDYVLPSHSNKPLNNNKPTSRSPYTNPNSLSSQTHNSYKSPNDFYTIKPIHTPLTTTPYPIYIPTHRTFSYSTSRPVTTVQPTSSYNRQRLTTTTDGDPRRNKHNFYNRVEESSVAPAQQQSVSTATARTLYNSSRYEPNRYDPYYALYDDDAELYRDVDYHQQYNTNSAQQQSPQQTYRGTPAPTVQASVETPKRGSTRDYVQSNYGTQDVYQPSTLSDYTDDNYNTHVDDQNNYRSSSKQPSRGDRNELSYVEEPASPPKRVTTTSTKKTTITTTTTTTTTSPRPIPTQKSTVPTRSPDTATTIQTRAQSILNTLSEDSEHLTTPTVDIKQTTTDTYKTKDVNPEFSLHVPIRAAVSQPAPFTLPKHLTSTEAPLHYHYITKPSLSNGLVTTTVRHDDTLFGKAIIPTTYSPPKLFLKSLLYLTNTSSTEAPEHVVNTPQKTLKSVRKLVSPEPEFDETRAHDTNQETDFSEFVQPNPYRHSTHVRSRPILNKQTISSGTTTTTTTTKPEWTKPIKTVQVTEAAVPKLSTYQIDEKYVHDRLTSRYNTEGLQKPEKRFRNTVEIPPPDQLLYNAEDLPKAEQDELPSYKPKPILKLDVQTKTVVDVPRNSTRTSRVNEAIKTQIAFGGTRRPNTKCNDTTPYANCNDSKQRPSTRGRGSAHYSGSSSGSSGNANGEIATVNRGTPPTRSRPTLKPSTSIVSKASEFIDIYKHLPRRPDAIYPQPQPDKTAAKCRKDVCLLPDCSCGGKEIPGDLPLEQVPQIVLLTFDDSVNDLNKGLYHDLFEKGRVNPNGCPIAATFYVSHEWTDYSQVQNLYSDGHEIASHTVSHSFGEQFSQKKWTREVAGQREILAAYGGVHLDDVRGMRAPFLSVGGNKMFKMLYDSNFTYDSSMPIYENKPPSWPYTLDYKLFHDCMIPPCPTRSYPGVWEVPMVMWQDLNGGRCSMGDACSNPPDAEGVLKMLMKNFERHYTTNRAPFGLFYHAAWFTQPHHKDGFIQFLDTINQMKDVWLVTNWQAIQWVRDPTPISRLNSFKPFQCDYSDRPKRCNNPKVCNLWHKSGVRYMRTCQPCPDIYPWTGNTGIRSSRIDNDIED